MPARRSLPTRPERSSLPWRPARRARSLCACSARALRRTPPIRRPAGGAERMRRGEDAVANGLPAAVAGPPVPARGEERRFDQRQRDDARAWALAGGVAIYGDI